MWNAWLKLDDYVSGTTNDGVTPFELANDQAIFEYYRDNPVAGNNFEKFMSFVSAGDIPIALSHVPWGDFAPGSKILDIGGGYGDVAAAIKKEHPNLELYSLDLPEVISADKSSGHPPPADVTMVAGDMFDVRTIPEGIDGIFMKHILHDWDDESCKQILKTCNESLASGGKVFIAEAILPDPGEGTDLNRAQYSLDMLMMMVGGKERTISQWTELAKASGFIESFTHTPAPICQIITFTKI
jgi:ubiquinone/menaquinone biosynthesis C-methylase UbiE